MKTIYLAGGCFWGTQKFFDQFPGVLGTRVGYAAGISGGRRSERSLPAGRAPSYQDVCRGSGHAETVRVDFDEARLSLEDLLAYYFLSIDPLSVNRQGNDRGIQYRTGIYYDDPSLLEGIRTVCRKKEQELGRPLAVEVLPLDRFWDAEDYHQKYLDKNPGGYCHIPSRLLHLDLDRS